MALHLAAIMIALSSQTWAQNRGVVEGAVKNSVTRAPVAGATVALGEGYRAYHCFGVERGRAPSPRTTNGRAAG
jgi:hypothetical protein